ncbi:uncharacterized protein N0V89_004984 [Didymosphaeria variabile]|uniref:DNA-directed DNA polymerase n=1 Tax=Didymosphaeria variabile TaxID=1932322 RepID=A0A9W9CAS7_9PLEO|nr:uncharacterized protein N0V89_004984 [Didymosphaeria variabile]KAJ4353257.1 hypothetical protein N0V89_004984 [Didymosphaeria variabile]
MADKELQEKVTYFMQQNLLDLSDDEEGFPDSGLVAAEQLFADFKAMPPPPPVRRGSSFLGPTPRERQQEFETHTAQQRAAVRKHDPSLLRSSTAPNTVTKSFPVAKLEQGDRAPQRFLKKTASMSDLAAQDRTPFYKRMGEIPRELKNANAKAATNIVVEPVHKQLLREKLVYLFPNNDITWVKSWRDDVTHVIFDDDKQTYPQLLRHLNRAGLPSGIPLDPTSSRFLVKGAPRPSVTSTPAPPDSQGSLKIKPSRREQAANSSQKTDSVTTEATPTEPHIEEPPISSGDIVRDSFVRPPESTFEAAKPPKEYNDELSKVINATRAVAHLPLDDEEDGDSRPTSSAGTDSGRDTDEEEPQPTSMRTRSQRTAVAPTKRKNGVNQNTFQCMNPMGASSASFNPNARTIEILEQMGKYYDQMQDQWRTLAYRKAVTTLRKQTVKISTAKEAAALPFVGSRLADKIEEIVLTDRLRRLDSTRDDPTDKVLRLFLGVYGAGLVQANKWIQAGHRTLDDLIANAKLTDSQRIGIEHYHDFATRIPRAEVEAHGEYVRDALRKIDPGFETTVMGSYRRGAKDSGDIDIIMTKPGARVSALRDVVFHKLVPRLLKDGFLKVKLAASSSSTDDGTKWHGVSCLPSSATWRRLDLLLVPEEEMGAALLYFTGNDIFNRSIRLLASKKGMRLNQRGLYKDVIRGKNREKLNEGTLLEGKEERRIFEILGVPWREPTERIC